MEGDVEGLEDLKFQGLLLHPHKYFNKRLREILFVLVFQAASFEVVGEGRGGGGYMASMGRGLQLRPSNPDPC